MSSLLLIPLPPWDPLCARLCVSTGSRGKAQTIPCTYRQKASLDGGSFLHQESQRPGRLHLILQPNEEQAKHCRENVHKGGDKPDSRLDRMSSSRSHLVIPVGVTLTLALTLAAFTGCSCPPQPSTVPLEWELRVWFLNCFPTSIKSKV